MSNERRGLVIRSAAKMYSVQPLQPNFFDSLEAIPTQTAYVIDSRVADVHKDFFSSILEKPETYLFFADEHRKSLDSVVELISFLIKLGFRRTGQIVAIGGGIVQDVVGFVAAVFMRGVSWTLIPTTLLAQSDSCIGGKSSINVGGKKNIVGTFYPPDRVLIDTRFLLSLDRHDLQSGIGEMLHYLFYKDSAALTTVIANYDHLIKNPLELEPYIWECLEIKKGVIELDEHDQGERNKFNYGHTFGHALEAATDYLIPHGLAVTVGMDLANFISMKEGHIGRNQYRKYRSLLQTNFPDYDLTTIDISFYLDCLRADKKNINENLRCVLMKGIGKLFMAELALNERLAETIAVYFRTTSSPDLLQT
jgi:3-dehydroquinate synthase